MLERCTEACGYAAAISKFKVLRFAFIQIMSMTLYLTLFFIAAVFPFVCTHVAAAICLGSFGVPVKSEVVKRLDVDPLVVQVSLFIEHIFAKYHLNIVNNILVSLTKQQCAS